MNGARIALAAGLLVAAVLVVRRLRGEGGAVELAADPQPITTEYGWNPGPSVSSLLESIAVAVTPTSSSSRWTPPAAAAPYLERIAAAEAQHGVPPGLLARLLYQESRYRPEIIDGRVRSPVGAMGIAQFMPATAAELGIDPLNPDQAIPAAARYLASLYRITGSWALALAAYNWGIGNVTRKGFAAAPAETRNYVAQITADVPVA